MIEYATGAGSEDTEEESEPLHTTDSDTTPTGSNNPFNNDLEFDNSNWNPPSDSTPNDSDSSSQSDSGMTTTPTGSNNPFNWNLDGEGGVEPPDRFADSVTNGETYEYDYDYGGDLVDDSPAQTATEEARELAVTIQGNDGPGGNGSVLAAVGIVVALFAVAISFLGGD